MKVQLTTVASLIGALANGVQFSEALQVAITGRGAPPPGWGGGGRGHRPGA